MKKIFTTIICTMAFCSVMAVADKAIFADVNRDGLIDNSDAQLIYSYILGTADANLSIAQVDVNGDGVVNTLDVVEVYIAAKEFVAVTSITLDNTEVKLKKGDVLQLTATINPSNATFQTLIWKSNFPSVATVDENGVVTAISNGTASISVTATNGVKATCVIMVQGMDGHGYDSDDSEFGY